MEDINRNPGFEKMAQIGAVLSGESVQDIQEDPNVLVSFRCTPMMYVDCERAFNVFKDILGSKRNKLTEEHLKDQMLLQWNSALLQSDCCTQLKLTCKQI